MNKEAVSSPYRSEIDAADARLHGLLTDFLNTAESRLTEFDLEVLGDFVVSPQDLERLALALKRLRRCQPRTTTRSRSWWRRLLGMGGPAFDLEGLFEKRDLEKRALDLQRERMIQSPRMMLPLAPKPPPTMMPSHGTPVTK